MSFLTLIESAVKAGVKDEEGYIVIFDRDQEGADISLSFGWNAECGVWHAIARDETYAVSFLSRPGATIEVAVEGAMNGLLDYYSGAAYEPHTVGYSIKVPTR